MGVANVATGVNRSVSEFVLELRDITAGYGSAMVLHDVDLAVRSRTVVALLGANGAGKSTLLRVAAGLLRPTQGAVWANGADMTTKSPHERVQAGLCLIPDGRGIFPSLSVKENLSLAVPNWKRTTSFEPALEVFPILEQRLGQKAMTLSGGEQRMLALARCYLSDPAVVMLDELSMGLAPRIIEQIFESLTRLIRTGVSLLLVEQYVDRALEMADTVYLLSQGKIVFSGAAAKLDADSVMRGYLGAKFNSTGHERSIGE